MKKFLCTAAVLALSTSIGSAQEADDAQMLALTQNVLQGITGEPSASTQTEAPDLNSLISQAMEQGQSDEYLDALIVEAVDRGEIEVPDAMVSTEGEVDTKTLLASLVGQSLQVTSSDADLVSEASGQVEVAVAEPRNHTVESGESLAGIALQYYGDASRYETIFQANRDKIERPNLIRVGQVILIP